MTCLRTESFLKPFGLQDLRILFRLMKNSVYLNSPHTIDDLKMAITEYNENADYTILNTVFKNTVRRVQ